MDTLRSRIKSALDESTDADPALVAKLVNDQVPDDELREAFTVALTPLVKNVAGQMRRVTESAQPTERETPAVTRSPKVAAVAQWWQQMLRERVAVGEGRWAFLGDMTHDELVYAAEERRKQAQHTMERAQAFKRLADLVHHNGVARVRDLPPAVLQKAVPPAVQAA